LDKSADKFYIMRGKKNQGGVYVDDSEEYTFVIKSIVLYVQQGTLSLPLYEEIMRSWPSNDILYHFRRFDVMPLCVTSNTRCFYSDKLWSEADSPG
jgi:hypothetical protein